MAWMVDPIPERSIMGSTPKHYNYYVAKHKYFSPELPVPQEDGDTRISLDCERTRVMNVVLQDAEKIGVETLVAYLKQLGWKRKNTAHQRSDMLFVHADSNKTVSIPHQKNKRWPKILQSVMNELVIVHHQSIGCMLADLIILEGTGKT